MNKVPIPTAAHELAQTNLQLFEQMRQAGYSTADVTRVDQAYQFATRLFANQFRACGKPFVAHLVGTAAVLVWLHEETEIVIAGLLHAVYQEGDFSGSLPGMAPNKRRQLKKLFGPTIEELVAAYTGGSRNLTGIQASYASFNQMSSFERTVLTLQLANELDDYRDRAPLYANNSEARLAKIKTCGEQQAEMACWLGHPELADALRATYRECINGQPYSAQRSLHSDGYQIMPGSCRESLTHLALRARRKLTRILRRRV